MQAQAMAGRVVILGKPGISSYSLNGFGQVTGLVPCLSLVGFCEANQGKDNKVLWAF